MSDPASIFEAVMSLPKVDAKGKVSPDIYEMIKIMARFEDQKIQEWVGKKLEKVVIAEFHEFTLLADRIQNSGLAGQDRD